MGRAMVAERTYTHYAQDPTVMTFRAPSVLTKAERICFKRQVRDYDTDDLVLNQMRTLFARTRGVFSV